MNKTTLEERIMDSIKVIETIIYEYNEFFQFGTFDPGVVDLCCEYIDDKDYYGADFTKQNKMLQLVFTGDSTYFVGIWVGEEKPESYLTLPVYVIDLHDDTHTYKSKGNYRTFMTNYVLQSSYNTNMGKADDCEIDESTFQTLKAQLLTDLGKLPKHCVHNNPYILKIDE